MMGLRLNLSDTGEYWSDGAAAATDHDGGDYTGCANLGQALDPAMS